MKKVLVCILALALTLSGFSLADPVKTIMDPYSPYEETLVITTAKPAVASPNFADPNDSQGDNALIRYIEEKLNVDIQLVWESDDYTNKLALQMAASDLPDFFTLNSATSTGYLMYRQLVENGMLADMTEGIEKCLGDEIKRGLAGYNGNHLTAFTEDGKIYAYASPQYAFDSNHLLWLRQDWMDALNLPAPKTMEDLENILIAFRDNYNSKGLSLDSGVPLDWSPIAAAYGAFPGAFVSDENGEIIYGSLMKGTRDALELLARWYKDGLIDKEFVTRGDTTSLFTGGETGVLMGPWWMPYSIAQLAADHPEAKVSVHDAPLDANGKFNMVGPYQSGTILVVNAKFENPEAPMKIYSVEHRVSEGTDEEGVAAVAADRENSVSNGAMDPLCNISCTPFDYVPLSGAYIRQYVDTGVLDPDYEYPDPLQVARGDSAKKFVDGESTVGDAFINYYAWYISANKFGEDCINVVPRVFSYTTESMGDFKPNLDAMEQTTFLKIIIGEEPIEAFDAFCERWMAEGGELILQEVRSQVGN